MDVIHMQKQYFNQYIDISNFKCIKKDSHVDNQSLTTLTQTLLHFNTDGHH